MKDLKMRKKKSINKGEKTMLKLSHPSIRNELVNNVSKKLLEVFVSDLIPKALCRLRACQEQSKYTHNDGIERSY